MTNPQALREALPSSAGWVAFDLDECTVTIAVDSADEVRAVRDALPSRNRVRVFDATTVATAVIQGDARGIMEQWQPRIGDEVKLSSAFLEGYPDWKPDERFWVAEIRKERASGYPVDGLNITLSEEWPVRSRTGGYTDGFYIGRAYEADDIEPAKALATPEKDA